MLAVVNRMEEKDQNKQRDYEKIARSLWNHPNIDKGKKRKGKTADAMVKSKKIFSQIFSHSIMRLM